MNPRQTELLGILREEASEVIQVTSKIDRFPDKESREKNFGKLHLEIGDFLGIMRMLMDEGILDGDKLQLAAEDKIVRVEQYMRNKKVNAFVTKESQ